MPLAARFPNLDFEWCAACYLHCYCCWRQCVRVIRRNSPLLLLLPRPWTGEFATSILTAVLVPLIIYASSELQCREYADLI
jgi:hypothetical protein